MYGQSPLQQPQLSSLEQFGQPQTAGTREYGQQFGATAGIRSQQSGQPVQQFQQPSLPSQFGASAQSTWAQSQQIPQFGQTPQSAHQFGQTPQQLGQVPQQAQIPVGSGSTQQIPVEHGQHSAHQTPWQSFGHQDIARQGVETADTPTLLQTRH